jgi:acyl dehydratase
MIDTKYIGTKYAPLEVNVEEGQLKFFAKSVGETDPIYTDLSAAKEAGYRHIPAPPTFIFSLNLAQPDPFKKYTDMGIDLNSVLHGTQKFEYFSPICAGDSIRLETTVTDIYAKKGGALEFMVEQTSAINQLGDLVANAIQTLVIRNA